MKFLHVWVQDHTDDGSVLICSNCDTRKGSRASFLPCDAAYDNIEPLDGRGTE
jgi:hypothetical protein